MLKENGLPDAHITFTPTPAVVLPPKSKKKDYVTLLKPFGIDVRVGHIEISKDHPVIRTHVLITEIRQGSLLQFGLKPPTRINAELVPRWNWQNDNPEDSTARLDLLESQGKAQVLASPNLLSESGTETEFMAGGEIPIRLPGTRSSVEWRKHGVLLKVKPTVKARKIKMQLDIEVSSINFSQSVDGLPGFSVHRLKTQIHTKPGQVLALSGLLQIDKGQNREGWPLLSRLPVLGPLFSSRNHHKDKKELIIFLKPELVKSDATKNH